MQDFISVFSGVFAFGLAAWLTLLFSMYVTNKTWNDPKHGNRQSKTNNSNSKRLTA